MGYGSPCRRDSERLRRPWTVAVARRLRVRSEPGIVATLEAVVEARRARPPGRMDAGMFYRTGPSGDAFCAIFAVRNTVRRLDDGRDDSRRRSKKRDAKF